MRVFILVNVLNHIDSFVYSNHIHFFIKTIKDMLQHRINKEADKIIENIDNGNYQKIKDAVFKLKNITAEQNLIFFTPPRMSIDMARNTAAREALRYECDYLMFIDDDVAIPADTLDQLINCDADIAAGLVIIRGYPFNVMAFKPTTKDDELPYFNDLPKIEHEGKKYLKNPVTQDDGLNAVGFSCALIKCDLLKKISPPYFITGPHHTEDVYFCLKARDAINYLKKIKPETPDLKIALNTRVQPGHFLHPEPIEYTTIDIFKEFYETLDPKIKEKVDLDLRGIDYIKQNTKHLG